MSLKILTELQPDHSDYQKHRQLLISYLARHREEWSSNLSDNLSNQNTEVHLSVYHAIDEQQNDSNTFHVLWDHRNIKTSFDSILEKNKERLLLESFLEVIHVGNFQHHGQGFIIRSMEALGYSGQSFSGMHLSREKVISSPADAKFYYLFSHELTHRDVYLDPRFNEINHPYAVREVRAFLGSFALFPLVTLQVAYKRQIQAYNSERSEFMEESRKGFLAAYFIFVNLLTQLDSNFKNSLKTNLFLPLEDPDQFIKYIETHQQRLKTVLLDITQNTLVASDLYNQASQISSDYSFALPIPNEVFKSTSTVITKPENSSNN